MQSNKKYAFIRPLVFILKDFLFDKSKCTIIDKHTFTVFISISLAENWIN